MTVDHRTRTRLPRAERARLISTAATELFAHRGYASTSVEDIAGAAGITKPMLYRHFDSKRELAIALLQRYRDDLIAATLEELAAPPARPRSATQRNRQLAAMIDSWLTWVQAHPAATRLLFTPIRGDEEVQRVQEELFHRQSESQLALLREFAPDLPETDGAPLAEISRAGFAAVALWWLDHPDLPRSVAHRALLTMAVGIITTDLG